jgi:hypothetical protein
LRKIKLFKEEYTPFSSSVLDVVPTYTNELASANKASQFIAEVKEKHRNDRDAYYKECEPHYLSLRDILNKLDVAEPLINQTINEKKEADRKNTRRFIIATLLTILGIGVGCTTLYLKVSGAI